MRATLHATPQAEAALVNAVSVARAVKQVAPQPVMRNNRIDVEHAAAAASNEFGVDGPPGTARKPATATNMTAMTHSVTQRIGSGWARRMTIAPAAAAAAMPPPVMTSAAPWVTTPDQSNAAAPSTAVHRHAAIAVNRAGTRVGVSGFDHRVPCIAPGPLRCWGGGGREQQQLAIADSVVAEACRLVELLLPHAGQIPLPALDCGDWAAVDEVDDRRQQRADERITR